MIARQGPRPCLYCGRYLSPASTRRGYVRHRSCHWRWYYDTQRPELMVCTCENYEEDPTLSWLGAIQCRHCGKLPLDEATPRPPAA